MPFTLHAILFALQAVSYTVIICSVTTALAVPMPMPLLIASRSHTNLTSSGDSSSHQRMKHVMKNEHTPHVLVSRSDSLVERGLLAGNILGSHDTDLLGVLHGYGSSANQHALDLQALSSHSSNIKSSDSSFEQQCASAVTGLHGDILNFHGVFRDLAADKGLKNYDRDAELETLLKNIVNSQKNALSSIDHIVYRLPILGKTLGPIVYDIKCILDDVLNTVENLSDGLINKLKFEPLLHSVIGSSVTSACNSGVDLLLCLSL